MKKHSELLTNKTITIFDVGASGGFIDLPLLHKHISIYAFEPQPESYELLEKKYSENNFKSATLFNIALSNKIGTGIFYKATHHSMSSLLQPDNENFKTNFNRITNSKTWISNIDTKATITVDLSTIDSIASQNKIENIDFLKLDTQGTELDIIKGAEELIKNKKISIIKSEVLFTPVYKNQNYFSELDIYLRSNGYQFIDCHFYPEIAQRENKFAIGNKVVEKPKMMQNGDAFYVLDFTKIRNPDKDKLLKSGIILASLGFYSNATTLLEQYGMKKNEIKNLLLEFTDISFKNTIKSALKRITPPIIAYWYSRIKFYKNLYSF
ncbi:MAG: FkbM family methyltransferase [Bacteroidetes bacterium]|nr:FkbM family methyltransferase [Bacteroidota bacterium]